MRLPLSKPYRAFPEFDPFTDFECRMCIWDGRRRRPFMSIGVATLQFVSVVLGTIVAFHALALVADIDYRYEARRPVLYAFMITAAVGVPLMLGFLGSLLIRDRWLRAAHRRRMDLAKCPRCRYSLVGLAIEQGPEGRFVLCPECGSQTRLKSAGLTAEDLLSPPTTASA